ncbi:hypothetical protein ACHAWT_005023, partial [Skeletonema menzelii]
VEKEETRPTARPTTTVGSVVQQQQQQNNPLPYYATNNNNVNNAVNTNNNVNNNNNNSPLYNAVATCGGGKVGNGLCSKINECCSTFGFCGTSDSHCSNRAPVSSASAAATTNAGTTTTTTANTMNGGAGQAVTEATSSIVGTCGGGSIGNTICPNSSECCSQYGFCGTTLQHCLGKQNNENNVPVQQPQQQQQQQPQFDATIDNNNGGPTVVTSGGIQYGGGHPEPLPSSTTTTTTTTTTTQGYSSTNINTIPHGTNKKIIGYFAGWQWYDRNKLADPSNFDFRKLQRVNYAFFQFDKQGELYGIDRWGDPQVLFGPYSSMLGGGVQKCSYDGPHDVNCGYHEHNEGLIYRAHQVGTEVFPSIGGWTLSDNFPSVSADPTARENFAENCIKILKYYDFDGIDIDWEYPGFVDHSGTPADKENYTKLLQAIRYRLDNLTRQTGKSYGLTAALPCNPKHIDNLEVDKLANILTEFNLMSYDLFGAWDPVTGANAPLYHQGFGDEDFNIHSCVENYVALGAPSERMNIGLPFYGRSFKGATALNQPHGGNDEANWPDDEGTPQYYNIYNKLPYMIQMRDNIGKTQYAYTKRGDPKLPPGGEMLPEGLVSFDDERAICDKVHYAQQNDLGGFIIWELSGDLLEDLRTPLLDITNKKLGNPSFQCCMLHSIDECEKERLEEEKRQQQQNQNQGGYSNSFGFDMNTWGGNENIRIQNGSVLVSPSIVSTIVIGCLSVLTTTWL